MKISYHSSKQSAGQRGSLKGIRNTYDQMKSKTMAHQNMGDAAKATLRVKLIALNGYVGE